MPTLLLLQANNINQLLNQHICPSYYVSWNTENLEWKVENISFRRMWRYYTVIVLNIIYVTLYVAIIHFFLWRDTEHRANFQNIIVGGLVALITIFILPVDYIFISNGREWVYATNWIFACEGINRQFNRECKKGNKRALSDVLHNIIIGW